jgi:hypothetical protein
MKQDFPKKGIKLLCSLFGKTRHAYYDHQWRAQDEGLKDEIVLQHVLKIREKQKKTGTLKLHFMLQEMLEGHNNLHSASRTMGLPKSGYGCLFKKDHGLGFSNCPFRPGLRRCAKYGYWQQKVQ